MNLDLYRLLSSKCNNTHYTPTLHINYKRFLLDVTIPSFLNSLKVPQSTHVSLITWVETLYVIFQAFICRHTHTHTFIPNLTIPNKIQIHSPNRQNNTSKTHCFGFMHARRVANFSGMVLLKFANLIIFRSRLEIVFRLLFYPQGFFIP